MGARQSKRSVDITTTPKKDGLPAEGSVAGDAAAPGDGKLERIEESDGKPTTNGNAPHSDAVADDKDKDKEKEKEKEKEEENDKDKDKDEDTEKEEVKVEDTRPESSNTDTPAVAEEATTPTDGNATPISPESATSPDSKDAKKKDKKKKWSLRSLSFGKRDRSKTTREDAPKNGDVTKEEPLPEGGEEAEAAVPEEASPAEEKTEVSSPTVESTPVEAAPAAPVKEEEKDAPASPTPVEEKKEEPTPAPTPVPVEEKKEEIEKVEPVVVADKVEVSPVQAIPVVGVDQAQPVATPSIIERKTSEDLPPLLPSSPPPTPIDPSPLQQAQQAAANASALAEALKVPAEAASMASQIAKEQVEHAKSLAESETTVVTESNIVEAKLTSESNPVTEVSQQVTEVIDSLKETEIPHVVEEDQSLPVASNECQIVAEVVKTVESEVVVSSQTVSDVLIEQVDNTLCSDDKVDVCLKSLKTQEIVENGVSSGLHSVSSENITSLAKELPDTEKIETPIAPETDLICNKSSLVIQSEEGPVPLSEESLVKAKPAFVVPEEDFTQSVIKAVETIDLHESEKKSEIIDVVLETDKIPLNESGSNVLLAENVETNSTDIKSNDAIETKSVPVNSMMNGLVDEIVPPLPESPIPSLEKSQGIGELLSEKVDESLNHLAGGSFVSPKTIMNDLSGHLDSEDVFDPIEELRACHMSVEGLVSPVKDTLQELSSSVTDILNLSESSPPLTKLASSTNEILPEISSCPQLTKEISNMPEDLPVPPNEFDASDESVMVCPVLTKNVSSPAQDIPELTTDPEICPMILKATNDPEVIIQNGSPAEEPLSPKISEEKVVSSPPSCPSPTHILISPKESSHFQLNDEQSNQEFEVESLSQSLNSYNDSDVQLKERLAESEGMNGLENSPSCPLLKAVPTVVPENAQKIPEPEAPAENPAEVSTTESVTEAPASPAPPVPAELPVLPPSEPALTEDVASVTKAIEDFEISDKAVAAAVNEAIESNNANEIVNDSLHQKVITE